MCVQEPCVYLLHAASTVIRNSTYVVQGTTCGERAVPHVRHDDSDGVPHGDLGQPASGQLCGGGPTTREEASSCQFFVAVFEVAHPSAFLQLFFVLQLARRFFFGYIFSQDHTMPDWKDSTVYEKIRCRSLKKHNLQIEKKFFFSFFKRTSNGHI